MGRPPGQTSNRPFVLSVRDEKRGTASVVGTFTTEATAQHALAAMVRRLEEISLKNLGGTNE